MENSTNMLNEIRSFADAHHLTHLSALIGGALRGGDEYMAWCYVLGNSVHLSRCGLNIAKEANGHTQLGICRHGNGAIKSIVEYKDGQRHGSGKHYHDNGEAYVKCSYKFGKLEGTLTMFHKNGMSKLYAEYSRDGLHGTMYMHRNTAITGGAPLKGVSNFKYGMRNGEHKRWGVDGNLYEEAFYENGIKIYQIV